MSHKKKKFLIKMILFFAVLIGGYFRFNNLNWDQGQAYHPDERNIAAAVSRLDLPWQLDPGFHAYNGFSIYLIRLITEIITYFTKDPSWSLDWGKINLVARFISATLSTITIPLVFLLGTRLSSPLLGLLGAVLTSLGAGFIQYAHYGVTESMMVFWLLLLANLSVSVLQSGQSLLLMGQMALISGLSLGTKTSTASFLVIPFITWLSQLKKASFLKSIFVGLYFLLLTVLTFFVVSPHTFLDKEKFFESMNYEGGVVSGRLSVPYNLQFTNTTPYLFFFNNLFWQLGPLVPLFGLGIFIWLFADLKRKKSSSLPILIFGLLYFLYVGYWHTKFLRYMIPLLPVIILGAAWTLQLIYRHNRLLGKALILLTTTSCFFWALAHNQVYNQTHTRIEASWWIYENLPSTATIAHEHWDDRIPTSLPGFVSSFQFVEVLSYEPDIKDKFETLANQLDKADFYTISSRRVYGSIVHNPQKYPAMTIFYQKLFAEELGYKLFKKFESYPRIGNLVISDDQAEETFQVYDHPVIYVFAKEDSFDPKVIEDLSLYAK